MPCGCTVHWSEINQCFTIDYCPMHKAAPKLLEALIELRNEVNGALGLSEPEIRESIGNANLGCLKSRLSKADRAISKAEEE